MRKAGSVDELHSGVSWLIPVFDRKKVSDSVWSLQVVCEWVFLPQSINMHVGLNQVSKLILGVCVHVSLMCLCVSVRD